MSSGYLTISVYNNTIGKPLENAKISIKGQNDTVVGELSTNISGQSGVITLEAPPLEYSLQPDSPMPYGEYDITITKDGFDTVVINDVQILGDATAEQNIFMKSIPVNQTATSLTYNIPYHTLYGDYPAKIPEDSVKPLSSASGFVVLDEPIIPEFIIVHDGLPNDSTAPDYWIPYKDYIKNVACSEIYATWPYECIKANVLAIISFTLNRVYTEWYRNQGYNFTVTSTTEYDHKFIYQRNFFEEISIVVDEIFSTFITKPNIKQPLFTQYCDGVRVTCPEWLSQWGSKYLADSGRNYMEILRNYYGTEIYLDTARQVLGVPTSYPGEVLQYGSSGSAVRTTQEQLNSISNNYPAISKIVVDGIYGENTTNAVKTFQEIFRLPQTGLVDYATWYQISRIYTAVNRLSS